MDFNTIYYFLFGFLLGFLHACVAFYFYLRRLHRRLSEYLNGLHETVERLLECVDKLVEVLEKRR